MNINGSLYVERIEAHISFLVDYCINSFVSDIFVDGIITVQSLILNFNYSHVAAIVSWGEFNQFMFLYSTVDIVISNCNRTAVAGINALMYDSTLRSATYLGEVTFQNGNYDTLVGGLIASVRRTEVLHVAIFITITEVNVSSNIDNK